MFEKTKLLMLFSFTLAFLAYSLLIGKYYDRLHIGRTAMWVICIVLSVIVAVIFIIDTFFTRHPGDPSAVDKK
jgi:hypothetical protein